MGKKKKSGAEDFAAETQEDQDTLPTDGSNILDDGGISPGTEDAPAAEETDTEERDDAALENPAVAPAGDAPGSDVVSDAAHDDAAPMDQAHDSSGDATDDATDAEPADLGELAEAAKPPESEPSQDAVGTAVQGTALADNQADPAHAGSDVVPTPAAAPAESIPQADGDDGEGRGDEAVLPEADADSAGVTGNDESDEATPGEDSAFASPEAGDEGDEGKPETSSTDSSALPPEGSSEDKPATEPEMPKLAEVQKEAAPIAKAAGEHTMGKFKEAGNLLTEGLASLREVEDKLERLGDEAKARLAHLRHKASEALAALEAWFSRS